MSDVESNFAALWWWPLRSLLLVLAGLILAWWASFIPWTQACRPHPTLPGQWEVVLRWCFAICSFLIPVLAREEGEDSSPHFHDCSPSQAAHLLHFLAWKRKSPPGLPFPCPQEGRAGILASASLDCLLGEFGATEKPGLQGQKTRAGNWKREHCLSLWGLL